MLEYIEIIFICVFALTLLVPAFKNPRDTKRAKAIRLNRIRKDQAIRLNQLRESYAERRGNEYDANRQLANKFN